MDGTAVTSRSIWPLARHPTRSVIAISSGHVGARSVPAFVYMRNNK